ncbi:hypothetical protein TVAG_253740 [Trichomonas vaginalis G3]|uniref:PQ loop repeat family protein n=1 Tax=Trichomonas vaginalis (strain ATCC PRA-98 / G3) TaxID=412133 RepID=A2DMP1_TRIV3|nr:PQ loop repeat-containing protein [Trichomonas vaginalis G3]EAY18262.1 hypothetical protein TVAG_253740 [Trichomonas vaginalis G3]KAI5541917.1 PQ loop repeat-containing protein [Trichomonas vaginalis G3]|eukprot:XP_001579248.1 hypothetical protein [Trichomonas vaginalis G3]
MSRWQTGFMDYKEIFYVPPSEDKPIYTVIGTIFFVIAACSFIPETMEMIQQRTSYGLSFFFVWGNSWGQFLLVVNFLCLNYTEFLGFLGYSFKITYPFLLVFFELFCQWILFLPCPYLTFIYADREHTAEKTEKQQLLGKIHCIGLVILNILASVVLLVIWIAGGMHFGFTSKFMTAFGDVCGYISLVLEIFQYLPQYIETIKIRDNGSLSLVMLSIQGPANLVNGLYMAVIRHESPSTYLTIIFDGAAEMGLLLLCLFFKIYRYVKEEPVDYGHLSSILLTPIEALTTTKDRKKKDEDQAGEVKSHQV